MSKDLPTVPYQAHLDRFLTLPARPLARFFARQIRPEARPIDDPNDLNVVSSPADCRLTAFPTTDAATKYWIKGYGFTLSKLLGSDEMAARFAGGAMVIARLARKSAGLSRIAIH